MFLTSIINGSILMKTSGISGRVLIKRCQIDFMYITFLYFTIYSIYILVNKFITLIFGLLNIQIFWLKWAMDFNKSRHLPGFALWLLKTRRNSLKRTNTLLCQKPIKKSICSVNKYFMKMRSLTKKYQIKKYMWKQQCQSFSITS